MSTARHIWGMSLLCVLPVAVGQVWAAPAENALDACRKLVNEAREVDRVLRTVSDRESGVSAAEALRPRMEYLRRVSEQLGGMPLGAGEETRMLEQLMRDLTHITQGYIPVVQRLEEVNAYGAEELIQLFHYYKMNTGSRADLQTETPLVRSYIDWCDAVDDVLYLLRRVQNAQTASIVVNELVPAMQKAEQRAEIAKRMQTGLSPQQLESECVPTTRLQHLMLDMESEYTRLRAKDCFGVKELKNLLPQLGRGERG